MFKILKLEVSPFQQNCRIICDTETKQALVVDPGGDVPQILAALEGDGLSCTQIWLTHSHLDHCGGVAELKDASGAKLFAHRVGAEMRARVQDIVAMYGLPSDLMQNCPEPEEYIDQGSVLEIAKVKFETFFTPGHSPDHVVFYAAEKKLLLAGDTVFQGSIGRTDVPGGNYEVFMQSIKSKIMSLPPETKILSGHGPDTTLGAELESNPFLHGL